MHKINVYLIVRFYNDVGDREEVSTNTASSGGTSFGSSEGSSSVDE